MPVAVAGPHHDLLLVAVGCGDGGGALVAGAAEERLHFGLDRGLDDQAGAEPGDVFEDLDQVTISGEQGVDLGTDARPSGRRPEDGAALAAPLRPRRAGGSGRAGRKRRITEAERSRIIAMVRQVPPGRLEVQPGGDLGAADETGPAYLRGRRPRLGR
ncbi:hypothetical protein GCM10010404_31420 [Nonomuraea africana]|uniref:Uncharacterized protein n=1 Tax=Nonomuraea africana TaxID=46171 RepID=A0ABR9KFP7_9ACTN|nr:hypothetical protein [Nonomuraea africana]MBE1560859.1 hypothetical protein [Nonomuraea africana]